MDPKRFTRRLVALGAAMFLVALVFVVTLFDAQIVHGDDYLAKSIRTNAKVETVKGTRGVITDRNGKVLVSNRAVYTLNFDLSLVSSDELNDALLRLIELMNAQGVEIRDILPLSQEAPYVYDTAKGGVRALVKYLVSLKWMDEKNVDEDGLPTSITGPALYLRLCSEYGVSEALPDDTARTLVGLRYALASARLNGSTVFEFASDVDVALISLIKDGSYAGVQVDTSSVRVYETDYAAHVLGYTGSIEDWDDYKDKDGYTLASIVGKSGAESAFEEYLHGSDGKRLVTFNDSGKVTGELYSVEPKPGSTVALTIDIDFQEDVEQALESTVTAMTKADGIDRGAAVAVVQVGTGDVLALASYPTYSLSTFRDEIAALTSDTMQPMWNRATQGTYAPGSTLKPLTAIAALESGATTVREKRLGQVGLSRLLCELYLLLEAQRPWVPQRARRDHEFMQLLFCRNGLPHGYGHPAQVLRGLRSRLADGHRDRRRRRPSPLPERGREPCALGGLRPGKPALYAAPARQLYCDALRRRRPLHDTLAQKRARERHGCARIRLRRRARADDRNERGKSLRRARRYARLSH